MTTKPIIDLLTPYMVGKAMPLNEDSPVLLLATLLDRAPEHHEFHRGRILEKREYEDYVLVLDTRTRKWETHRVTKLQKMLDEMNKENAHVS